jgi:hypothetical protein
MDDKMDIAELARELRLGAGNRLMRTSECLDEHERAAMAAGTFAAEVHERFKGHLADCDYCIARIGELARLGADVEPDPIPDLLLARARRLAAGKGRQSVLRRVRPAQWAAAAVVVLALAVVMQQPWAPLPEDETMFDGAPAADDSHPAARRIDPDALRPQITAPAPGSAITLEGAEFTWTPIEGGLYYEVFILTDTGDVLWRQRVNGTSLALQAAPPMETGREYFVRVDAYLAEARRVSSPHVVFTVEH